MDLLKSSTRMDLRMALDALEVVLHLTEGRDPDSAAVCRGVLAALRPTALSATYGGETTT